VGAFFGLVYTGIGLFTAYMDPARSVTTGGMILQFFVFSLFTVPFCALIFLGLGFLVEGFFSLLKSKRP
jgi:hypothetical protein